MIKTNSNILYSVKFLLEICNKRFMSARLFEFFSIDVNQDITPEVIKKAYHEKALIHHPDKSQKENANLIFQNMQKAYEALKTKEKIDFYIRFLKTSDAKEIYNHQKNLNNYFLDSDQIKLDAKLNKNCDFVQNEIEDKKNFMIIDEITEAEGVYVSQSGCKHLHYKIKLNKVVLSDNLTEIIYHLNSVKGYLSFEAQKIFNPENY